MDIGTSIIHCSLPTRMVCYNFLIYVRNMSSNNGIYVNVSLLSLASPMDM